MLNEIAEEAEDGMQKTIERTQAEYKRLRTGKATSALLDGIRVNAYGSLMPLNQLATVAVPEARLITIQPWDKTMMKEVEKAILASELGLTPSNDGSLIRLSVPQLTEERRRDLVRVVKKMAEESRVGLRSIRRESNDLLKVTEKSGDISVDQMHDGLSRVQELTDSYVKRIDALTEAKESEIMEI